MNQRARYFSKKL